jgi:hypothetical protein
MVRTHNLSYKIACTKVLILNTQHNSCIKQQPNTNKEKEKTKIHQRRLMQKNWALFKSSTEIVP